MNSAIRTFGHFASHIILVLVLFMILDKYQSSANRFRIESIQLRKVVTCGRLAAATRNLDAANFWIHINMDLSESISQQIEENYETINGQLQMSRKSNCKNTTFGDLNFSLKYQGINNNREIDSHWPNWKSEIVRSLDTEVQNDTIDSTNI